MSNENCACDELMVFILSKLHYRHTVIYTANRLWCTLRVDKPMDRSEIHSKCDVHLVYLGNLTFGELRRKPMTPATSKLTAETNQTEQEKRNGHLKPNKNYHHPLHP